MRTKKGEIEKDYTGILPLLLGASLFYGLMVVIQKMGLNAGLDPLSFSFSRSIWVVLFSLLFYSSQLKTVRAMEKRELTPLFILGAVAVPQRVEG